jgi:AcrR family transcriptional regulator
VSTDTESAIKAEFMREYAKKDFDRINVKELCANVPVARTTFYYHYGNIDDVRAQIEDDLVSTFEAVAIKAAGDDVVDMDFSDYLRHLEPVIKEHWGEVKAFLVTQPNLRFIDKWKRSIKDNFGKRYPNKTDIKSYGLIAEMVASSAIGGYAYWIEHPDQVSTDDVIATIDRALTAMTDAL